MSDRLITAEMRLDATDHTGQVFQAIARKLAGMEKAIPTSAKMNDLLKGLQRADAALKSIDKLQIAREKSGLARVQYDRAVASAKAAKKALDELAKPSQRMVQNYDAAAKAVKRAEDALRRQSAAVHMAKRAAEELGVPTKRLADEQERLRKVADNATKAIEKQAIAERQAAAAHAAAEKAQHRRTEGIRHHGAVNYGLGVAAGAVSAHSVARGIEHTLKAGARYQRERVALENAGRTPEEIREIEEHSRAVSRRVPTASHEENLKVVNETTGAFGSLHHALENLEFMQKAASVLHTAAGGKIHDSAGELGNKLARFFEERQVAGDTPTFQREAGALISAMAFTRGNFNPEQALNFAQQAKSSLPSYSERFLTKIAPSLITMMGGDRAGTAANAFSSVVTGKVNDKKQAEEWMRYGLLDPKQAIIKAGHAVGWRAGAVKDTKLALSDPLEWFEKVALPAMKAKGVNIDDKDDLRNALATMFRNSNSNMFATNLAQKASRDRLHKDEALMGKAGTYDEMYRRNLAQDPFTAMSGFSAAIESLMAAASSPAMKSAAGGISFLAEKLQSLSALAGEHPNVAMAGGAAGAAGALGGAGYLAYKVSTGFGLATSATALTGAAGELHAAAIALGAKGGVPGAVASKIPGAAIAPLGVGGLAALSLPFALIGGLAYLAAGKDQPEEIVRARAEMAELTKRIQMLDSLIAGGHGTPQTQGKRDAAQQRFDRLKRYVDSGGAPDPVDLAARQRAINETPQFTHPGMPGFQYRGARAKPGWDMPQWPIVPIAPAPTGMPTFANGQMPTLPGRPGMSGPLDVTGKVQAEVKSEVTSHVDAKVQVSITAPQGINAAVTNTTVVTKPGKGISMPGAAGSRPGYDSFL